MKVVALIGSNRGDKSTSAALIRYLEKQLMPHGIAVTYFYARSMYGNKEKRETFIKELQHLADNDFLIICAPNYVDSLPAPLINLMEEIRDSLGEKSLTGKRILAVIHSGYPELQQRKPGLEICRFFAAAMGLEWYGGLSFGGTSPIAGQPLETAGLFAKKIGPVLDRTAEQLGAGSLTQTEDLILEDVSAIPVPTWLVTILMNTMTRLKAFKEKQALRAKPY